MKRSEMKDLLIDKIVNKWDLPWEDFGDPALNQDEFADDILSWLEELGMSPPQRPYRYFVPEVTLGGEFKWEEE
jgi:hypothetical protein